MKQSPDECGFMREEGPRGRGSRLWFVVPLNGDRKTATWCAYYRLVPDEDGTPAVVEVRVAPPSLWSQLQRMSQPDAPDEPLTATLLRDHLAFGHHVYELLPQAADRLKSTMPEWQAGFDQWLKHLGFRSTKPREAKRGPQGEPDKAYALLAREYIELCETSSSPAQDLASRRDMTETALRAALTRARRRRVLTRTTPGRAGGQLTPYGESLLHEPTPEERKEQALAELEAFGIEVVYSTSTTKRTRCSARTKAGRRCRRMATWPGMKFCKQHGRSRWAS